MIENDKLELIRNCPQCGKKLQYKTKQKFNNAVEKNTLCLKCSRGKKPIPTRECPDCKKILTYSDNTKYRRAILANSLCKECCNKGERHYNFGESLTDEHKHKISEAIKGPNHPMYGKHHTEKGKENIRAAKKGKLCGDENPFFEHKHTDDTKKQISATKQGILLEEWNGFKFTLSNKIRFSEKGKKWRFFCLERDNFTCQNCGSKKSGNFEIHHIKSLALIIKENKISSIEDADKCEEIWNTDNGITLCKNCHKQTDTYGGKRLKINDE